MSDLKALSQIFRDFWDFLREPNGIKALTIFAILAAVVFALPLILVTSEFGGGIDRLERVQQRSTDRIVKALERACPHKLAKEGNSEVYE